MPIKQEWKVTDNCANYKLSGIIRLHNPALSGAVILKALKNKDIRINNIKCKDDLRLHSGDKITCYWPDSIKDDLNISDYSAEGIKGKADCKNNQYFKLIYEDNNLLVLSKKAGLQVHKNENEISEEITLIDLVHSIWSDQNIKLCHRLDRNTAGLILLAKNNSSYELISELIKNRLINKKYRCLVKGIPEKKTDVLKAWLQKDSHENHVYINDKPVKNAKQIITGYKVIKSWHNAKNKQKSFSELEIELITGRTHQIRAHMSYMGHPLLGDGKYGKNSYNKYFKDINGNFLKRQQLIAYSLSLPSYDIIAASSDKLNLRKDLLTEVAGRSFEINVEYDLDFSQI